MEQLMLINPRKRSGSRKKPRSAAQRRATARMLAANRSRRKSPAKSAPAYKSNPSPRRRRRAVPVSRIMRRRRRNPAPLMGGVMDQVVQSGQGAIGAIANDVLFTYIPLPVALKTGRIGLLAKGVSALALGMVGSKFMGRMGREMGKGALTVTLYTAMKDVAASAGMPLAGVGYVGPAPIANRRPALRRPAGMAEYVHPDAGYVGMGEYVA